VAEFKNPRKRFGQNFLHDQNIINKIISAINPKAEEPIIEIGPGRGALTLPVLEYVNQLHVIEIDRDLIQWWQDKNLGNLTIHPVDALKVNICEIEHKQPFRVIGNLPYNISTPLLFHLFEQLSCIQDMHFMLQKEVVDRMTAQPGSKTYGRLSVMTQFYCQAQALFTVSANSFDPPPKVESAIIRLTPNTDAYEVNAQQLGKIVQQAFSQRRKTIRNSLKNWFDATQLESLGIDPTARPETLDLATFIKLATAFQQHLPK